MAQAGVSLVGAYGAPIIQQDGSMLVDTEDGIPALGPAFNLLGTSLQPAIVNAVGLPGTAAGQGIPVLNAILVELRCLTRILQQQLGTQAEDIEQMRADELWNTTPGQGAI